MTDVDADAGAKSRPGLACEKSASIKSEARDFPGWGRPKRPFYNIEINYHIRRLADDGLLELPGKRNGRAGLGVDGQ